MSIVLILYVVNALLLILHEMEWEILNLPGGISGFLLMRIPIILLMFFGFYEIKTETALGYFFGMVFGIGGLIPFLVHKIFVKNKTHFNRVISNVLIYANIPTGIALAVFSAFKLFQK